MSLTYGMIFCVQSRCLFALLFNSAIHNSEDKQLEVCGSLSPALKLVTHVSNRNMRSLREVKDLALVVTADHLYHF